MGILPGIQTGGFAMALPLKLDAIEDLPRTPASDVKKLGWRGVMKAIGRSGKVLVTNHNAPEAVILSAEEYDAIQRALHEAGAGSASALDALRQQFDQRLASLQAADAGDRLRSVMRGPARLGGKVKAGASH
jgi:prevent-host-death family protein